MAFAGRTSTLMNVLSFIHTCIKRVSIISPPIEKMNGRAPAPFKCGAGLPQRRLALLGPRRGVGRGCLRGRVESAQRCLFGVKAESDGGQVPAVCHFGDPLEAGGILAAEDGNAMRLATSGVAFFGSVALWACEELLITRFC